MRITVGKLTSNPWAIVLREIGFFGFMAMMVFLGILIVGFIYEWKKGALEWE